MRDSPSTRTSPSPSDGDVIVTRESNCGACYTVRQIPGIVQYSVAQWEDAIRLARSFARNHAVDLWYRENGTESLLEAHRTATEGPRASFEMLPGLERPKSEAEGPS